MRSDGRGYADIISRTKGSAIVEEIGYLTLIDVGQITGMDANGRATVQTFRYAGATPVILTDIEVLQIGTPGAGIIVSGGPCLLFALKTPVTSLAEGALSTIYHGYDERTIKALPVATADTMDVKMSIDGDGIALLSETGCLRVLSGSLGVSDAEGACKAAISKGGTLTADLGYVNHFSSKPDGTLITTRWADGKVFYREESAPDGTITVYRNMYEEPTDEEVQDMSTYEKWQWIETFAPDGTHTTTQYNSDVKKLWELIDHPDGSRETIQYDGDDNEIYHNTLQPDGTEDGISVSPFTTTVTDSNGEEQVRIEGTNDGNLTITTKDGVSITADGDVTVTTKGNLQASVDGDINIEATKTGLLTLKNSIDSLGALFAALVDQVNTFSQNVQSIDTVGSPASHSAGPGIIANMVTLQTQLAQLKQKAGQVLG